MLPLLRYKFTDCGFPFKLGQGPIVWRNRVPVALTKSVVKSQAKYSDLASDTALVPSTISVLDKGTNHYHLHYSISDVHHPLLPKREKVLNDDHVKCSKIIRGDKDLPIHFMKLHTNKQMCTYIRVHEVTQPASGDSFDPSYEENNVQVMLKGVNINDKYLSFEHVEKIFRKPYLVQEGINELLQEFEPGPVFNPNSELITLKRMHIDGTFEVEEEEVMNSLTNVGLTIALNKHFHVGKVDLPKKYRKNFSYFGKSRNDSCIYHKDSFYFSNSRVVRLGIIGNVSNKYEPVHCVTISAGVIEYKMDCFAVPQTISEMICASGKILAKMLIEDGEVDEIKIYGLAFNYDFMGAKLVQININFNCNTSQVIVSDKETGVYTAITWLLNSIAP